MSEVGRSGAGGSRKVEAAPVPARAPALAGIATHQEAARIGLDVSTSVTRLHRYAYLEAATVRLMAARICGTPEWEVKGAAALHCWYDAEHVGMLKGRVAEMRSPPPDVLKAPTKSLEAFVEEFLRPHNTVEYLTGVYGVLKPALLEAYQRHVATSNPIAAHPTCRLLRLIIEEDAESVAWGEMALQSLVAEPAAKQVASAWREHLCAYLTAAGGIDGDSTSDDVALPAARAESEPFVITVEPARDHAGTDFVYDLMVRFEAPGVSEHEAAWGEMYDRVREMDAVELVAPHVARSDDKSWDYVRDMARQLWDEARHSMMGEVGFERVGADWRSIPIPDIASRGPNTELDPIEAHVVLWDIEQGMMPRKTGKGKQRDIAEQAGNSLGYQNQDYDWADEVLHTQIGRRWLLPEFGSREAMKQVAERCNQRLREVGMDSYLYDAEACSWWDSFYQELCELERRAGSPLPMPEPRPHSAPGSEPNDSP